MVLECTTTRCVFGPERLDCKQRGACGSATLLLASFNAKHPRSRHAHQLPHFDRLRLQMSEL